MIDTNLTLSGPDPFGLAEDVILAMTSPSLYSSQQSEQMRACLELVTSLGRCRLDGIDLGPDDVTVDAATARLAADALRRYAEAWPAALTKLREHLASLDSEDDAFEAMDVACEPVMCRHDAWAAWVVIADTAGAHPDDEDLAASAHRCKEAIARADETLRANVELLTGAARTNLLHNLRLPLLAKYRDPLPWWLDGTIERALKRGQEKGDTGVSSTPPGA